MPDEMMEEEPETKMFHVELRLALSNEEAFMRHIKVISEEYDIVSYVQDKEGVWIKAQKRR